MRGNWGAARGPLPSLAAMPRYKRVALAALRACMEPPFAPAGYNDACRALWLRFQTSRSVPSAEQFDVALYELYELLRDAGTPNGVFIGGDAGQALLVARRRLDALGDEARDCGLMSDEPEGDQPS